MRALRSVHVSLVFAVALAACGDDDHQHSDGAVDQAVADLASADLASADHPIFTFDLAGTDGGGGFGSCDSQCDCPAGTLCTIDHACEGLNGSTPYTAACDDQGQCPCGFVCDHGYCPPFTGSLNPCNAPCDCSFGELCVDRQCIVADGGGGATCSVDGDCSACAGTVCLPLSGDPGDQGYCGKSNQCFVDLNCVTDIAFGQFCRCPDGTASSCAGVGQCETFPGTVIADGPELDGTSSPSGGCEPNERSEVTVTSNASFSKVTLYAEVDGGGLPAIMHLSPPSGTPQDIGIGGSGPYVLIQPVSPLPPTLDGTWTLCNYANDGGNFRVLRWALYAE